MASLRLSDLLAVRLINQAANPVTIVIVTGVVMIVFVILVAVIVSGMGNDVLAHCEEVVIMVKPPLDPFGGMSLVSIECCNEFSTEG